MYEYENPGYGQRSAGKRTGHLAPLYRYQFEEDEDPPVTYRTPNVVTNDNAYRRSNAVANDNSETGDSVFDSSQSLPKQPLNNKIRYAPSTSENDRYGWDYGRNDDVTDSKDYLEASLDLSGREIPRSESSSGGLKPGNQDPKPTHRVRTYDMEPVSRRYVKDAENQKPKTPYSPKIDNSSRNVDKSRPDSNRVLSVSHGTKDGVNHAKDSDGRSMTSVKEADIANRSTTSRRDLDTSNMSYRDRWEYNRNILANKDGGYPDIHSSADVDRSGVSHRNVTDRRDQPQLSPQSDVTQRTPPERDVNKRSPPERDVNKKSPPDRSILSHRSLDTNRSISSQRDSSYMYLGSPKPETNRSIMSGEYRVQGYDSRTNLSRDYIENDLNKSSLSTRDCTDQSTMGSLKRDPLTHRKIPVSQQNGTARPVREGSLNQSRRSISLSRFSLNRLPKVTLYGRGYGVHNSLVTLVMMAIYALVLAALALQLVFRMTSRAAPGLADSNSVLTNTSYRSVKEVSVALATFVVMLDLCCLLVCALQCFFAAKLIKCPLGEERAFRYLKECTGTRFIVMLGFFISVPAFFLALLLYMLLEFHATSAIISTVIMTIGVTFAISTIVHSTYYWRVEKNKADLNIPVFDDGKKGKPNGDVARSQSELSTLV